MGLRAVATFGPVRNAPLRPADLRDMTAPNPYGPQRARSYPPRLPRRTAAPQPSARGHNRVHGPFPRRPLPPPNGHGTAGLVLGIIAVVFAVIPIAGVAAWFIWPVGLVLALIGFARVRRGEATNRGPALAGVITSGVAAAVCLLWLVITAVGAATAPSSQPPRNVSVLATAPQQRATTTAVAPAPAPPGGAATSVRDGTYEVGKDMAAGRYKTAGPPTDAIIKDCYWQRAKDDSGELRSIISSGDAQGSGSVTVKAGEFFQTSGGCTWTKQ